MFGLGPATRIYLAAGVTDMRKGFEGLYGLVRDRLSCEPLADTFSVLQSRVYLLNIWPARCGPA